MTPAVNLVKRRKLPYTLHQYTHDSSHSSYGLEAAEKLGLPLRQVFKTLVVVLDGKQLAVAVIPVSSMLNMKQMAHALGAKKASMADTDEVLRSTGYVLGGVSPLGQKRPLTTVVDSSALAYATIFVSAGRRGLEIELNPQDLVDLAAASVADIRSNS
jgi:Cys-tRNA(Pro)/Cys-tRNA(Cys) deacylase